MTGIGGGGEVVWAGGYAVAEDTGVGSPGLWDDALLDEGAGCGEDYAEEEGSAGARGVSGCV